jgi:hypothetical protein
MCCDVIFCQVEALELQVKDAASLQKDFDLKKEELEMELKAAVDKVLQSNLFDTLTLNSFPVFEILTSGLNEHYMFYFLLYLFIYLFIYFVKYSACILSAVTLNSFLFMTSLVS